MLYAGIILSFVGFALVAPRGAGSGSVAHRNIRMGSMFFETPGYERQDDERKIRASRNVRLVGAVMLVVGVVLIAAGS